MRRTVRFAVPIIGLLMLTGCIGGPTATIQTYTDGSGTKRCTLGRSFIAEPSEMESGLAVAWGSSATTKGSSCDVQDTVEPSWFLMGARTQVWFVNESSYWQSCGLKTPWVYSVGSDSAVWEKARAWCGASLYQSISEHFSVTPSGGRVDVGSYSQPSTLP